MNNHNYTKCFGFLLEVHSNKELTAVTKANITAAVQDVLRLLPGDDSGFYANPPAPKGELAKAFVNVSSTVHRLDKPAAKMTQNGSAEFQHMTLGDVRKLLKELEQYGDETELRIAAIADNPDARMEGVAPVSMEVEFVEDGDEGPELWITIEGE